MRMYFFVATSLPDLQLGVPPEITFQDFKHLMHDNLPGKDLAKTEVIRRYYDILNMRSFWKKEPLDPRGNLHEVDLEQAMLMRQGLPEYIYDFLEANDSIEARLANFPQLVASYFNVESAKAYGFLRKYLQFEREWRLVFTAFRAKQLGRDLTKELQFEDPTDDFVAQLLAQKDAKTIVPPEGYEDLKVLFEEHGTSPLDLYKALCEYRFAHIQEMLGTDVFSIDYILGYMAQLITAEKWIELDQQKGMEIVNKAMQFS